MNRFSEDSGIGVANPASINHTHGVQGEPSTNGPDGEVVTAAGERETASGAGGERDEKGRFVRGNRGGAGNPFARQTAALRKRLLGRVTDSDLDAIADRLIQQAKDGDVASIKVLFSYVIGKPAAAVDPDTLDVQEWQTQRDQVIAPKDLSVLMNGVPAETVVPVMREVVPCLGRNFAKTLLGKMADRGWPEAMPYVERGTATSAAPSTNGSNDRSANRSNRKKRRHRK